MKATAKEVFGKYIYASESEIKKVMALHQMKKCRLFLVSYVDQSNYANIGFSAYKLDTDYLFNQKSISKKTKTFNA